MIKDGCQCFTCRHADEPRVVAGYLQGYIDACDWFLNWAKKNNIKQGSIADDDLGGIIAQMDCNRTESGCLLTCFPDLEVDIKSQDDCQKEVTSKQGRDSEVLLEAISKLETTTKQLEIALKALETFACEKLVFKTNEGIEYTLQGKFQNSSVAINALNKIKELDK